MSKSSLLLIIGIIIICMPFLGLPGSWKTVVYVICGIILIARVLHGYLRKRVTAISEEIVENRIPEEQNNNQNQKQS